MSSYTYITITDNSPTVNDLSLLLRLPRELIYKIAGIDAGVYNRILRLCRATASLFPLSTRLDFMVAFGVHVDLNDGGVFWFWGDESHSVFGPADVFSPGDRTYYWRGNLHRVDGPAVLWSYRIQWYVWGLIHRDLAAPAGTGVEWLMGAACMVSNKMDVVVRWSTDGKTVRRVKYSATTDPYKYAQVRAEMDYWRAQG